MNSVLDTFYLVQFIIKYQYILKLVNSAILCEQKNTIDLQISELGNVSSATVVMFFHFVRWPQWKLQVKWPKMNYVKICGSFLKNLLHASFKTAT